MIRRSNKRRKGVLNREVHPIHLANPVPAGTELSSLIEIREDVWEGWFNNSLEGNRPTLIAAPTEAITFKD